MHRKKDRRTLTLRQDEQAYQQGLRRRVSDREELWAYYLMVAVTFGMVLFIGVGSWFSR